MELDELRKQLDQIDEQLAHLYEQRMEIIENVRICKLKNNLPIYAPSRENSMIEKNSKYIKNKSLLPYYQEFLNCCTKTSKEYMTNTNKNWEK